MYLNSWKEILEYFYAGKSVPRIEIFKIPALKKYNGRQIKFFKMYYSLTVLAYIMSIFLKHCRSCTSENGWHEEDA